jgi:autotransporter-like protein
MLYGTRLDLQTRDNERRLHKNLHQTTSGPKVATALTAFAFCFVGTAAWAQVGCDGMNATTDSGARSAELAASIQQQTVAKAKAAAGLDVIPTFAGVSISASWTDHDGYRLKNPVTQTDCSHNPITITQLLPFESNAVSASALMEWDLTKHFGLPAGDLFRFGVAVGGKQLTTNYNGLIRIQNTSPGFTNLGVNIGNGNLSENGAQIDLYSLYARGPSYFIFASSIGFGQSEIKNGAFTSPVAGIGGPFGGGRGDTNYGDYSFSGTVGHVFTLGTHARSRVLLDLSAGLLYTHYQRDAFTDSTGVQFSDANTQEFSGKLEAKLAFVTPVDGGTVTPFVKLGVKQRFEFDSTVTVFNPSTGACPKNSCPFTAAYDLTSDNTFWRVGGGIATNLYGDRHTGLIEMFYDGSGDSRELGIRAQYIVKLN